MLQNRPFIVSSEGEATTANTRGETVGRWRWSAVWFDSKGLYRIPEDQALEPEQGVRVPLELGVRLLELGVLLLPENNNISYKPAVKWIFFVQSLRELGCNSPELGVLKTPRLDPTSSFLFGVLNLPSYNS